jgi:nitrous oxide reductase
LVLSLACYNTEQANTLLEVNASQKDKDFIMAVNWKKAEEYLAAGKGKKVSTRMHIILMTKIHMRHFRN